MRIKFNSTFLLFAILTTMFAVSCNDNDQKAPDNVRRDIILSADERDIVNSQTKFAFDYFKRTFEYKSSSDNFTISPISLSINLAMLANGADEQTYNTLMDVMYLSDATAQELNALYGKLLPELMSLDRKVEVSMANALWHSSRIEINPEFANSIRSNYPAASLLSLDFSDSDGILSQVNGWVSQQTNGRITNVFKDKVSFETTNFILSNAMYFNGEWTKAFEKSKNEMRPFTNNDDTQSTVETMYNRSSEFMCAHTGREDVACLSYGNGAFSLYLIIPTPDEEDPESNISFDEYISKFEYDKWVQLKKRLDYTDLTIYLPKFNIKTDLSSIGVALFPELSPVTVAPNLSKMTETDSGMLLINQSNTIEVTEKGTTAATVTTSSGEFLAMQPYKIEFNRPFIYLIEEQSTGAILFMGRVVKL